MCEFCVQHGEGEKWYLDMKNYSRELLDQQNRREFIVDTRVNFEARYSKWLTALDRVRNIPVVSGFIRRMAVRYHKSAHWGQVVPIEDVEQILDLQDSIVRLPCYCRTLTTGREERYCFGLGVDVLDMLGKYPDYNGVELMDREEAKKLVRSFDEKGLVHSVWTFKTPYIGGLCNCDHDCVSYRIQVKENLMQTMFRAEYVGLIDHDLCNGCRQCRMFCQFDAIHYSYTNKKATVQMKKCFGCGICRAVCPREAISLVPRARLYDLPW